MHLMPAVFGLMTGLSLIVAIGSQNAYLLRLGIAGSTRVVLPAVVVCAVSDAVLILAGVLGVGALVQSTPQALTVIRVVGAAFLITYALMAARRVIRPDGGALEAGDVREAAPGAGARRAVLTMLALTWLNPHVYLDTVVMLGSIANGQPQGRWWWVAGAVAASVIWFTALGFGARLLRPVFSRPVAWRVLDAFVAIVMLTLGLRIALGV
ncbi:LysE/ArgO family amino acid transporter [Kineosporia sp. NBRC 101731]|uniref:LysE/ArgO family amino acid transporter n=1 Tax=Kineosporia sp. NBRC 101731 TaxID=3032199 RepID=UPI0024A3B113|nr:LysE/ArgO family amino acid transporter [Kineosporia sp. NBRC 101731]GLY31795.1 amino acid transporter [Kineosporia sp. NBRC 101731]